MDGVLHRDEGRYEAPGEIHAAWVLEGRAIQDVWILRTPGWKLSPCESVPTVGGILCL
jgi:hypothetical protein